jgi:hypothetical protein
MRSGDAAGLRRRRLVRPDKAARESSLHAVGWGLVFKDLPRSIAPFFSNPYVDRGSVLEDAWKREPRLRRKFPDSAPYLASWRPTKDGRECPGVIFNAMTASAGEPMLFSTVGLPSVLSGFDFYRRYPGRDIPMTTAVRLSATFPYVSPASRADVDDEKRGYTHVVDGGYFDNYGVSSLAAVMHTALGALPASTTKRRVLVVEICDAAICSGDPAPGGPSVGGKDRGWPYQIIAPLSAVMAMRSSAQRVTNRTTLRLLKDYWRTRGTCIESLVVPFNNGEAPMSWHLTAREKQQITDGWNKIAAEKLGGVRQFLAGKAATAEGAACLAGRDGQEAAEGQRDATSIAKEALVEGQGLCEAVFVAADRSSEKQVLASVDASGRRFCNGLLGITATGRPTILQSIDTWQVEKVQISSPTWTRTERTNSSCLASQLAGAPAESAACLTMARDKLLRLSGSNPRAGFDAASAWIVIPSFLAGQNEHSRKGRELQ